MEKSLGILRDRFGDGPVSIADFLELETVRDSIIHADSKAEWMRGKTLRSVAQMYRDSSLTWVNFGEAHLRDAIEKSVKQVKWYDERLDTVHQRGSAR